MELRKSNRSQARIRMALQGPSGSGKTYSALKLAYGICKDWSKIAVIDTEHQSADLYAHLGNYNVLSLSAPFTPERYKEALEKCEDAGMDVIIIDSISHEWEGEGGILDLHTQMAGNSFANWSKLTPRHNAFVQRILKSGKHIIATIRSKQEYVLTDRNGKNVPEKVGMKGVQRDGLEYDFTLVFELDIHHNVTCSKDRTQLFSNRISFKIDEHTGEKIMSWCKAAEPHSAKEAEKLIDACTSIAELNQLYKHTPFIRKYSTFLNNKAYLLRLQDETEKKLNRKYEHTEKLEQSR